MKVLVYGAGVIGCFLAHTLCASGQDVALLARGAWRAELKKNGLVIRHRLQRKTTVDRPRILEKPLPDEYHDAVFAVMQHQQMAEILDDLAAINTPLVVLVGNNMSAQEHWTRILAQTKTPKTVLFGFQGTGGRREGSVVHCVRLGGGSMSLGGLHKEPTEQEKAAITALFASTKYRLTWVRDMDAWYKTHLTLILPVAYLCYAVGCDLRRTSSAQRKQVLDAAGQACGLLKRLGIPLLPEGADLYYKPGGKRALMAGLLWIMAKTVVGELAATDHCRHAVTEMEELDAAFQKLREDAPEWEIPAFDALRAAMPDWARLHTLYEAEKRREL
ncbi:MAG: ketopantoate reductase family protein [Oscillospiraceae bacterium]|nr:ketopantoate reductase family protein [Oscillospiraceae bacterium]